MPLPVCPSARLPVLLLAVLVSPLQAQAPADSADLPPAGFGTLRQDDVAVRFATTNLQVRVLPLDERVIRLLATDTYAALHQLLAARAGDIDRMAAQHALRRPQLFLVTFFGLQPLSEFAPDEIVITSQNRLFRPVGILPISAQWGDLRLAQRETASAIYLMEEGIALSQPLLVAYGAVTSPQWEQSVRALDVERSRVYSRAAAAPRLN